MRQKTIRKIINETLTKCSGEIQVPRAARASLRCIHILLRTAIHWDYVFYTGLMSKTLVLQI